jgi:large repetitive protein
MAMSPRLLRPKATGFNPKSISGLALWLDATDSTTTIADQGISTWNDKSGLGRNFAQTTGNNQPTVSTLNGRRALAFNGTSAEMTLTGVAPSALADATGAASFVVFRPSSDTSYGVLLLDGIASTAHRERFTDGFSYTGTFRSPRAPGIINGLMPTNTAAILTHHVVQPVAHIIRINRSQVQSDSLVSATTFTTWRSLSVGTHRIGKDSVDFLNGVIGEILVYGRGLTAAEVQRVENYLAGKWGIA